MGSRTTIVEPNTYSTVAVRWRSRVGPISPKLWLVGVPILIALFIYRPSPLLVIMALLAAPQVWKVLRGHETEEEKAYYVTSAETRFTYGIAYLGLAGFLAIMCHELSMELPRT